MRQQPNRDRDDEQGPDTFDPNVDPNQNPGQPAPGDDREQPADPEANR